MKKICLAYVASPINVIAAISAIITRHKSNNISVIVLMQWPGLACEIEEELMLAFKCMLKPYLFVEQIRLISSKAYVDLISNSDIVTFTESFRKWIGFDRVDEIYYPHDVSGQLYQGLATVYGDARRICFGDSMGLVHIRHEFLSYMQNTKMESSPMSKSIIYTLVRKFRSFGVKALNKLSLYLTKSTDQMVSRLILKDFRPHESILIIPIDESGNFLQQLPLTVVSKKNALDVINKSAESCISLQSYINELIVKYRNRKIYLFLTENFAEAAYIDFEREIEMYSHFISTHCDQEGIIILKSHPGETLPRNEQLISRLKNKFEIIKIEEEFRRYPIELWSDLVVRSTVISAAYPVVSLKYLYEINVVQPLGLEEIKYWFPEKMWALLEANRRVYTEPLNRLKTWDEKSVLWAGNFHS